MKLGPAAAAAATGIQVGSAMVATRFVVEQTGPASLALLRYAIGCCILVPIVFASGPVPRFERRDLVPIAALGITQFGILIALLNFGLRFVPSGRGALIFSTFPFLTMIIAAAVGYERLTGAKIAGVLLTIVGVGLSLGERVVQSSSNAGEWLGELAVLASALCGAACSVLYRPYLRKYSALPVSAFAMFASVLFLAGPAAGEGFFSARPQFTPGGWFAVAFIGVGSGVGYCLWLWALAHASPTEVTVFLALSPITAAVLGVLLLGERVSVASLLGLMFVAVGLWLACRRPAEIARAPAADDLPLSRGRDGLRGLSTRARELDTGGAHDDDQPSPDSNSTERHPRGRRPMRVTAERLRALTREILKRGGSADAEADLVAEHLVGANLAGHDSHGVGMIPAYVRHLQAGLVVPNTRAKVVKDDGAVLMFDGGRGYGRCVAGEAMTAGIARGRQTGVVALTLANAHHIGRVGMYGELASRAGLVSLHFVNVTDHRGLVAPFRGTDARFSTNPVCIALPGTDRHPPVLLDMATSAVAMGKIRVARNEGKPAPEGVLIGPDGQPTRDPHVMYREPHGALLPFGGHKGYALAVVTELLAGALSGGPTIQPGNERRGGTVNNMFAVLIDPARLAGVDWLRREIDGFVDYVKASPPSDPGAPVLVPGDPERSAREDRTRAGIAIDDATWQEVLDAGEKLGLTRDEATRLVM